MTTTFKSISFAAALTLAAALAMTAGQTIIHPDTAQAGVLSSVKKAAKKVGGAAKTVGKAAVTVAKKNPVSTGVKNAAVVVARSRAGTLIKDVGVNVGRDVKKIVKKVTH